MLKNNEKSFEIIVAIIVCLAVVGVARATAPYLVVDDFESYADNTALQATWIPSGGYVYLETDPNLVRDGNSMEYYYGNSSSPYYAEADAYTTGPNPLPGPPSGSDWTVGGVKALALYFYGQSGNDANEQMYVRLHDADSNAVVTYGDYGEDPNDLRVEQWQEWNIDLEDFNSAGVDLTNVTRITIGFGDGSAGGDGTVYFDDIRLYLPRCRPEYSWQYGDLTGNCVVDYEDLEKMARDWLADVFFGLAHTALGQAQLSVDSNGLVVSNIGSTGEDGVCVALPDNITLWEADILSLEDPNDPLNPIPDGAFIEATARGIVDGIPDSIVSVVRHEDTGAQVTTTVDFSALGPNSLTANYYLNGELVLTEPNISPDSTTWLCSLWPNTSGMAVGSLQIIKNWESPSATVTTPNGNKVETNLVEVSTVPSDGSGFVQCCFFGWLQHLLPHLLPHFPPHYYGYSEARLTAAYVPSLVITGEAVYLSTGAPFTSTDITGDSKVNFMDYAILANNWLDEKLWP